MLTDNRIRELWDECRPHQRKYGNTFECFARAVEAETREDADECIKAQEDLLRELRAERDALRADAERWRWYRANQLQRSGGHLDQWADRNIASDALAKACTHQWVDATNAVVKSGEVCVKCGALR